jgi:hypothetical protein
MQTTREEAALHPCGAGPGLQTSRGAKFRCYSAAGDVLRQRNSAAGKLRRCGPMVLLYLVFPSFRGRFTGLESLFSLPAGKAGGAKSGVS